MSFFRGLLVVVVMLGVAVVSTGAFAAVPLTMTHQGRLLDASDQPIDGFFDITYRIFEVPSGGSPLWIELHSSVQVTNGLFSALLGSTVPLSPDVLGSGGGGGGGALSTRYLEVSVGGTTLTPRLRLGSVPSAISAGHVSGDIETLPGLVVIGDPLTDNHATFGEKVNQGLQSAGSALSQGATRITNDCDGASASQVMEKKGLNAVNVKLARTISSPPGGLLAVDALDMDSDDDGVMDRSISSSLDATGARLKVHNLGSSGQDGVELSALPTTSSMAIKTKGTGAAHNRSITSTTNPEVATTLLEADLDGDGVMDNTSADSVGTGGASRRLAVHNLGSSGQDGVSVDLRCSPDSTIETTELRRNGAVVSADYGRHTPFHNKRTSSFFDVFTEVSIEDVCDSAGASRRLKSHNLGSSGNDGVEVQLSARPKGGMVKVTASQNSQSLRCSNSADSAAATMLVDADLDGDGLADRSVSSSADATGARLKVSNIGSSGQDGVSLIALPTTSSVAINTKGTGADKNRIASTTNAETATTILEADLDGDGVSDATSVDSVGTGGASRRLAVHNIGSSGQDGVDVQLSARHKGGIVKITASQNSQSLRCSSSADSAAATTLLEADLDGDGVADRVIREQCDDDDASITVARGSSEIKIRHKGWDGTIKGRMAIENGGAIEVDFAGDGVGFVSQRFGIGVLSPTHPFEHSSGAHLTAGGVWTNASDANLKENFQPVDGQELLEKIAELQISQWNYKSESDEAKHIGPTAQDFRAAFGVGANDKSISTIDPAGIALAAIKALNSKMQELNAKTSQLEDQAREITQLKAELDAIKAMLQKQAETKN